MGNEVLTGWASTRAGKSPVLPADAPPLRRAGKKKLHWHTTFGKIHVTEPLFRQGGKQLRPFSETAHAQRISLAQALDKPTPYPTHAGSTRLILETDGSMILIAAVCAGDTGKTPWLEQQKRI